MQPLFPPPPKDPLPTLPKRLREMHRAYGHGPQGQRCAYCLHLQRHFANTSYYKCHKSRVSSSASTDWRLHWPACALFTRRQGGLP